MLSILKEAGQADNLAVLLLVGRSLAFYMLKATVRQPFSPLYTSSPPPSTHARSPRSLVFHPTAALFRAAPTHNGYGSTVENRRVFLSEHQFRFLPSLLSSGIYTLIISTLPLLRYSTNRDLRVRPKARRLRASHRRVSLYKGKVKVLPSREDWLRRKRERNGWMGRKRSKEEGEQEV